MCQSHCSHCKQLCPLCSHGAQLRSVLVSDQHPPEDGEVVQVQTVLLQPVEKGADSFPESRALGTAAKGHLLP